MSHDKPAISQFIEVHLICGACRRRTPQFLDILLKGDHVKCSHGSCGEPIELTHGDRALIMNKLATACREIRDESDYYRAFPPQAEFDPLRNP